VARRSTSFLDDISGEATRGSSLFFTTNIQCRQVSFPEEETLGPQGSHSRLFPYTSSSLAQLLTHALPPVGVTFLPLPAVEALGWGRGSAPSLYAAACKRFDLDFVFLPASEPWAKDAIDCVIAAGTAPFWVVSGPFGAVASRDGWIESLRATESSPQMIAGRMDAVMPDLVEQALRGVQLGAAAVVIAEDVAAANGPLLAPDFVLRELAPRAGRLAAIAHRHSIPTAFHSDGDVRFALPALKQQGFSAVHPGGLCHSGFEDFTREAALLDLAVLGGIDGETLRSQDFSPQKISDRLLTLTRRGKMLLADDGGMTGAEELVNFEIFLHAWRAIQRDEEAK